MHRAWTLDSQSEEFEFSLAYGRMGHPTPSVPMSGNPVKDDGLLNRNKEISTTRPEENQDQPQPGC
jgi:hypothetical protein